MADTHLNAYLAELEVAQQDLANAKARVADLHRQIAEKRRTEGLPEEAPEEAVVPEEAQGFGDRKGKR